MSEKSLWALTTEDKAFKATGSCPHCCTTPQARRYNDNLGCRYCRNASDVITGPLSPTEALGLAKSGGIGPAFKTMAEGAAWVAEHKNDTRQQKWDRFQIRLAEMGQANLIPQVDALLKKEGWL